MNKRANIELAVVVLGCAVKLLQQQLSNDEIREILISERNITLLLGE